MVHRRWLFSEKVSRVGVGSTDRYACVIVDGRAFDSDASKKSVPKTAADLAWTAWPPGGPIPIEAFVATRLDDSGWTVQSETADLDGATVEVKEGGVVRPV